jgi:uncharacterized protein (DUF1697 family)
VTTYIALLRGINVGGAKAVAMADLRALLERLGFARAQSLLQSGNLVFQGRAKKTAELERLLEAAAAKHLALETHFVVRTAAEWHEMVSGNPFPKEAERDPARLVVSFLKKAPAAADVKVLQTAIAGRETLKVDGRHAYIVYPDGQGASKLTNMLIEKKLGTRATSRNWNTVLKLAAAASAPYE